MIGDYVGNLLATASTRCRPCFVVFFFSLTFFFFFLGTCLLLLWFFFFPYESLCSRSEIIRSPSDLCSSLCSFISSRFDHNFIPVYKPKFTGKAETERNRPNLKNRSRFSKQYDSTTVRTSLCFFFHWAVLEAKKTAKLRGSWFFQLDRTVRFGFQNIVQKWNTLSFQLATSRI